MVFLMVWQLQAVEALAAEPSPDPSRVERSALEISQFLSEAPTDFLEPLVSSPFGRVYKLFLERCCQRNLSGASAETRRNELSQKLRQTGCESQEGWATLLALFPYFPPQQLKVEEAAAKLPAWLNEIYSNRYEASTSPATALSAKATGTPAFDDRIFLNRMLGLSNLYYIDPEDQEILQELREIRLQTVDLMLSVSQSEQTISGRFRRPFLGNGTKRRSKGKLGRQRKQQTRFASAMAERNSAKPSSGWWDSTLRSRFAVQRARKRPTCRPRPQFTPVVC